MLSDERSLPLPCGLDEGSGEIARAWLLSDGRVSVCIDVSRETDPFRWGMILHDLAKNVARAAATRWQDESGAMADEASVLEEIYEGFVAEQDNPTDEVTTLERS